MVKDWVVIKGQNGQKYSAGFLVMGQVES